MYRIGASKSQTCGSLLLTGKGTNGRTVCRYKEICPDAGSTNREVFGLVPAERPLLHGNPFALSSSPLGTMDLSFGGQSGAGAVELDALAALHPGTISRLLAETLGCYCSLKLAQQVRTEAQSIVRELGPRLQDRLKCWIPVLGTCGELERATPAGDVTSWLYDSSRGYVSQLASYRRYLDFDSGPRPEDRYGAASAKLTEVASSYKKLG